MKTSKSVLPSKGKMLLYKNKVEVVLDQNTLWLSQAQIAEAFDVERSVTTKHLRNVFKSKELEKNSVCAKFAHTASDGKKYQTQFYNLDAIISVGYRVNSKKGTQFRIWATKILKQHLVDGYTLNEKKLAATHQKYKELQQSIKLLENVVQFEQISDDAKGLIQVITSYTKALDLLDGFDHEKLSIPKGIKKAKFELTYSEACHVIDIMKKKFNDSSLVGQEKDSSFKSSLGAIYQTSGKKDVYPTVQEKAANLLYLVTKNHSFVDGNKRIAAALFICFLQKNGILFRKNGEARINNNTLVALTLMIAMSKPVEKEMLIKVILNLLK